MPTVPRNVRLGAGSPPSSGDPHAYFNRLMTLPGAKGWSLRDQVQLNSLVNRGTSYFWRYLTPGQTHPYSPGSPIRDAAMLAKPPRNTFSQYPELVTYGDVGDENVPGNQKLRFPLGITSGSFLITWDEWWSEEFQTNAGWANNPVDAWKTFFLFAGSGLSGTNTLWCGHDHIGSARTIAGAVSQHHDGPTGSTPFAPGTIAGDPRNPTGEGAAPARSFSTFYNRWTRYWLEVRMAQDGSAFTAWANTANGGVPLVGTWDMLSLWIADEQRHPTRVLYQVPIMRDPAVNPMYSQFRISYDTSTTNKIGGGLVGPVMAFARNVAVVPLDADSAGVFSAEARPVP